jgi:hypothetical protein
VEAVLYSCPSLSGCLFCVHVCTCTCAVPADNCSSCNHFIARHAAGSTAWKVCAFVMALKQHQIWLPCAPALAKATLARATCHQHSNNGAACFLTTKCNHSRCISKSAQMYWLAADTSGNQTSKQGLFRLLVTLDAPTLTMQHPDGHHVRVALGWKAQSSNRVCSQWG